MSYTSRYQKGDWKAICDVCGRELKASRLKQRWDGLMVCQQDWEPRHPQDFVRGVAESADTFVHLICTVYGQQGIASFAIAGCAIAGQPRLPWADSVPQSSFTP
jgi:hypothetical protein